MANDDAPTTKLFPSLTNLMDLACISLKLYEYGKFREYVETENVAEATGLLQKSKEDLAKLDGPDLAEIKDKKGDEAYYEAVDEQMDKFMDVSHLLDEWEAFLASDNSAIVLSEYATIKWRELGGK